MAAAASIIVLGDYKVKVHDNEILGKGAFGSVYKGTDTRKSISVAVKRMELNKICQRAANKIGSIAVTEIKNLQKLPSHPHIVKFLDFHFYDNSFWMVMEFCNFGNLEEYFNKYKPIDFVTKVELMQQATSAIAHLHGLPVPIIHRDLKPANIMMHYAGDRPAVKVSDFGLAKVAESIPDMAETFMMSTDVGTPIFKAPEFFLNQKYTSSVDVFALGLVFLGMLNYDDIGKMLPVFKPNSLRMPFGMAIAHALESSSSLPTIVEIKQSESKDMKEVKEVIKKMVMPKKEDRVKAQQVSTTLKKIFDKPRQPCDRVLETTVTWENKRYNIRKITVGKQAHFTWPGQERILMLVGAIGAGKSTLINGLVNYIMGVKYEDEYRYKLVDHEGSGSQGHSQTRWITAYTLHKRENWKLPCTLTIIDTPGFGDTEGVERDKKITKQIKEFFSIEGPQGIDHLDGIGFVVQAPLPRLSPTQRYIFDSILSIFGKDISQNIFVMVTFADGNKPPVLDAIREAKFEFQRSFKFNNSALYAAKENNRDEKDSSDEDEDNTTFNSMYWKMGENSYKDFFRTFGKTQSVSLQLIKEVLHQREHLECVIQGLQDNIQAALRQAEELHQEERIIKEHQKDMLINKDFTYKVTLEKLRKVDLPCGVHVTNCLTCNRTCHYPCPIPGDEYKSRCRAMGSDGYCEVCPGRCYWNKHVSNSYRFEVYVEKETRTSEELTRRYYEAASKKTAAENVTARLKQDRQNLYLTLFEMIRQANGLIQRLDEIALRPNPLTDIQYIDLLIEAERMEAKQGFQRRIEALNNVREKAKIVSEIKDENKP